MPALALADALPDFGSLSPLRHAAPMGDMDAHTRQPASVIIPAPPAEPDPAIVAAEVARAEAALAARLETEHQEALQALEQAHASAIAALEEKMGETLGGVIEQRLAQAGDRILELTGATVARILSVSATAGVQERAMSALSDCIRNALKDREAVRISIKGPRSLYERLVPALGRFAEQASYIEASDMDLTVSIDESVFETRMAEWSTALAEVIAP